MQKISIDPITRLEGHGRIDIFLNDEGNVANAYHYRTFTTEVIVAVHIVGMAVIPRHKLGCRRAIGQILSGNVQSPI